MDVPPGIPDITTKDPLSSEDFVHYDPIEFQGAWCASVSEADAASMFPRVSILRFKGRTLRSTLR